MGSYYHDYLKSERWSYTARAAKRRVGYKCQVCNSSDETLDAHHRTYERLGDERDEDITVLCRTCHGLFHAHKRGGMTDPQTACLAQFHAERPFLFGLVQLALCVTFNADTCFVIFGSDAPDELVSRCSGFSIGDYVIESARVSYPTGGVRLATEAEAAIAASAGVTA